MKDSVCIKTLSQYKSLLLLHFLLCTKYVVQQPVECIAPVWQKPLWSPESGVSVCVWSDSYCRSKFVLCRRLGRKPADSCGATSWYHSFHYQTISWKPHNVLDSFWNSLCPSKLLLSVGTGWYPSLHYRTSLNRKESYRFTAFLFYISYVFEI